MVDLRLIGLGLALVMFADACFIQYGCGLYFLRYHSPYLRGAYEYLSQKHTPLCPKI